MKSYEKTETVPPYLPFIVRADGKNFSKFTSGLEAPFDDRFYRAMVRTANEVLQFFNARTVFVCSDEITLIFDRVVTREEYDRKLKTGETINPHTYGGRRFKLETIIASKCSVLFNRFMRDEVELSLEQSLEQPTDFTYPDAVIGRVRRMDQIFDARLIVFGEGLDYEIVNNLIWRSMHECYRNAVGTYGRHYLGRSRIFGKNSEEVVQLMRDDGVDWDRIPLHYLYGVYCKKELVELTTDTGEKYHRGIVRNRSIRITDLVDTALTFLLAKYLDS